MTKQRITFHTVMYAVSVLLLHKVGGDNDICLGSLNASRYRSELQVLLGMFVNTNVQRMSLDSDGSKQITLNDLMQKAKNDTTEMMSHSVVPFDILVSRLCSSHRSTLSTPVFQVLFAAYDGDFFNDDTVLERLEASTNIRACKHRSELSSQSELAAIAKFDVNLFFMIEDTVSCSMDIIYSGSLFDDLTMSRIAQRWVSLMEQLFGDNMLLETNASVSSIHLALPEELQLYEQVNASARIDIGTHRCLHEMILESAQRYPNKEAVVLDNQSLTYSRLIERALQVAKVMYVRAGVRQGDVVVQCVERSLEMVVGMVAIQLLGAVYCPVHPEDPVERIAFVVKNVNAKCVLSMLEFDHLFLRSRDSEESKVVCYMDESSLIDKFDHFDSSTIMTNSRTKSQCALEKQGCYMITTSGSTGQPKTLCISHNNFFAFIQSIVCEQRWDASDRVLQTSRCSFDVHIFEVYGVLSLGATVVMLRKNGLLDLPYILEAVIMQKCVSRLPFVPSVAATLFDYVETQASMTKTGRTVDVFQSVKSWAFIGEPLPSKIALWIQEHNLNTRIVNFYGPSECTVYSTYKEVENREPTKKDSIPIGKPLANYSCFVFDPVQFSLTNNAADLREVPIGVAGELFIGGAGVMIGYVGEGSEELNKKALIHHPKYGGPLYKTGDLVKWLPDGNLMFLGRTDFQVKIRGQRLEIGEVEAVIKKHPEVNDVLVMKREDVAEQAYLAAYCICKEDSVGLAEKLTQLCKNSLAGYMVPRAWVFMENFPLNKNGKVDRKQLPTPSAALRTKELVLPKSKTEKDMWLVWSQFFKRTDFGVTDSFLSDLGGNSMMAMSLLTKMHKFVQLTIPLFLKNQTIAQIALLCDQKQKSVVDSTMKKTKI
jgi:amino acid adenylation domain-containing protein